MRQEYINMGGSSSKKAIGEIFPEDESSSSEEDKEANRDTSKFSQQSRDLPPELQDEEQMCK